MTVLATPASVSGTYFKAVRVTDLAVSTAYAPDHLRQIVRQRLVRALRAVTDAPIRFAVIPFASDLDPAEGGGLEYRAFAGERAAAHVESVRAARKAGVIL